MMTASTRPEASRGRGRRGFSLAGRLAAVILALALAPGSFGARELDAAAVLERVQSWLDGTRDLQARFEQKLASGALGTGLEESGTVSLLRPGRMRWDYLEPERKVALVEGDETRLYLEEDRQLWKGGLDEAGGLLPLLLSSDERIAELFESSLTATPKRGGEGAYAVKLVPREGNETFRSVVLTVRPPRFAIEAAEVTDGAGNRMQYRFLDLRRNQGLSPSVFHFEPPPGTEVMLQP